MSEKKLNTTAGIIIIGNEILSGRTQDLNIAYIGKSLEKIGVILTEAIVIPDLEATIINNVRNYSERFDYVFTTGGIGPTHDDLTTASIAKAFNVTLLRNAEAVERMRDYYPEGDLTEARLKMADIPEGAILIDNLVSAAPGYQLKNLFVMAGVPSIMQAMFDGLSDRLFGDDPILTASVSTNLTESKLAEGMSLLQAECEQVSIGSYPYFKQGQLGVNVVLRSTDMDLLIKRLDAIKKTDNGYWWQAIRSNFTKLKCVCIYFISSNESCHQISQLQAQRHCFLLEKTNINR